MITPSDASPDRNANKPKPITTIPAVLKKSGACFEWAKYADPKERNASTGIVPREKANIMSAPEINDPLPSATTCID